jgi:hypothetical protein
MQNSKGEQRDKPSEPAPTSKPSQANELLDENKHKNTSGLSWDETTPKPGENFSRATEMGEAD